MLFANEEQIKKYEKLKEKVKYYAEKYYTENISEISDQEYDFLYKELEKMEKEHPDLIEKDSPTQKVGGLTQKEIFKKVTHTLPMLSLDNTYNEEEITDFHLRLLKNVQKNSVDYVCELKIDGLSISVRYEKGKMKQAITRGNGLIGEDVTGNVKMIKSIPKELSEKIDIEVRGEIYLPNSEFNRINIEREENGLQIFANPRNAASGTLKLLDSKEVKNRNLDCFFYYILNSEKYNLNTQSEAIEFLRKIGFKTNENNKTVSNIYEVIDYWKYWETNRLSLKYEIDGIVVKANDFEVQKELGNTVKSPRWAISFKFKAQQKETKIKEIVLQVGSSGIITPVANLEPVHLEGSTVKRCSLHNFELMKEKDIKVGDTVIIQKAGGIIPQILNVVKEKRTGDEKEIKIPEKCPVCEGETGKLSSFEVAVRCLNPSCPEKKFRIIEKFVSRNAMNIDGLGPKLIKRFIENNIIKNIPDIYELNEEKIKSLGYGIKEKITENLLNQIKNSKNAGLDKILYGLSIPLVGKKAAKDLADKFETIDNLINATAEEIKDIEGIGSEIAYSLERYFKNENNLETIEKLRNAGLIMRAPKRSQKDGILNGETICQTGSLTKMTRSEFAEYVENFGAQFTNTLTKKTTFLVYGDNAGSKLDKAKKMEIKIMNEKEFFEKY